MPCFSVLFKLRDLCAIEPWGEPGSKKLHWFGLTDGCYCIDTPAGRLLEHAGQADSDLGERWCDYQLARIFEDLIDIWPTVSDPIPSDIVRYFAKWHAQHFDRSDESAEVGLYDAFDHWYAHKIKGIDWTTSSEPVAAAFSWWYERHLDTMYLYKGPSLHLWRVGAQLHVAWDADHPWLPAHARLRFSFEAVSESIETFFRDFLAMMKTRISDIVRDGWNGEDCDLDVERLVLEQAEREETAMAALTALRPTDWNLVRAGLHELNEAW